MRKLLLPICILAFLTSTALHAQDHLIVTEFVVTPTAGEFVEIYNPTDSAIDLTNYYLTDATFSPNNQNYYNIVKGAGVKPDSVGGAGGGSFGDWHGQFPAGSMIAPGEYQTISLSGSDNFMGEYGVDPTYELYEDGGTADAIPDLLEAVPGSINGQGGLSGGEVIILYYWDGASDLVQDVEYVLFGDKNEGVDKTGVSIDGPDADADSSTYLDDTPISDQHVVNSENDDDDDPHDFGMSAQRRLDVEDVETWVGGNGMTGHDETSENVSWKGGIWSINEPATPGRRALSVRLGDGTVRDSLTIADLQFIRAEDVGADANDDSPVLGDTLSVTGVVMHSTRGLSIGARWATYLQDARGGPWSGFFVVQNDTAVGGTNLQNAQPGDEIRITGQMQEFPTNANTQSISQFALFTDPVTPVEFINFGVPLPEPILMTPGDIGATGSSEDPKLTERWESTLVRFEGLTVLSNFAGQPSNMMTAGDATGTITIDDYFLVLRTLLDNNNGVWPGFPTGTKINITGFIRDVNTGGSGRTTINPVSLDAIEAASSPPSIVNIARSPVAVTSADAVVVSATMTDAQTSVANAEVNYRADGGAFQTVAMTDAGSDVWEGTIPAQADGAFIEFFLTAADTDGDNTTSPGDTSTAKLFYFVRDAGLSIFDIQFTPFADGNSSYANLDVTVSGIVTSDSSDYAFYFIQDGEEPWNGIHVDDLVNNAKLGDNVTISGTARERFNVTQIHQVTSFTVNNTGNTVPGPIVVQTGDLTTGSATAEQWEGMLMRVENVTVSNPFPDGTRNFGEFSVDDGSGALRVNDLGNFRGNLDSAFVQDQEIASITGIAERSFGNDKLEPRNDSDVRIFPVSVEDDLLPLTFALEQNYPNPFNPETTINFQIPEQSDVKIEVFNILGQRVRTLLNKQVSAGSYVIQWRGANDVGLQVSSGVYIYKMKAGNYVKVQKMLFLK